jgi:tetratricopeptide (TPR) repeat protein
MAQPATTPKIEELRFKVKSDAKSRLFYPLAEELRKIGQFADAEHVLRSGLASHPTYLSAWVSLGRVQRELKNDQGAVESLSKAMTLDPGNVVAARLLGDSYLALGEKLEALKKYKLVHALLPGDEELEGVIEHLDNELNPITIAAPPPPPPEPEQIAPAPDESPFAEEEPPPPPPPVAEVAAETRDEEPMAVAHDESPFEEPVAESYSSAAVEVEAPEGIHIEPMPLLAEVAAPVAPQPVEESDVFAPAEPAIAEPSEDITNTLTMADLYARQGLTDDARHIYESILQRDPHNAAVREKLDALNPPPPPPPAPAPSTRNAKVERLENWLHKVGRREASHV